MTYGAAQFASLSAPYFDYAVRDECIIFCRSGLWPRALGVPYEAKACFHTT